MVRDELGICLSQDMLSDNLDSTFTHVRAYSLEQNHIDEDVQVLLAFPQMRGKDVLHSVKCNKKLLWRADFYCPSINK